MGNARLLSLVLAAMSRIRRLVSASLGSERCSLIALWPLLTLSVLIGCGDDTTVRPEAPADSESSHPLRIGYSAPGLDSAQTLIMRGLVERAEAKGWEVLTANANRDADTQTRQIEYMIAEGARAIVAVPVDSSGICAAVETAREQEIPFFTIDRAPIGCEVEMAILADNFTGAAQAGQAMVDLLTERHGAPRGVVLELMGDLRQDVGQMRRDGFHSVVDSHPEIEVISRETNWLPARFTEITTETLDERQIDGIYMHSDGVGIPSVLPVLQNRGLLIPRGQPGHIIIVAFDGTGAALDAIREGHIDQTSSQPLTDYGIIVDWIEREMSGETIHEQEVVIEGALWSPATLSRSETGWTLILRTTSVTAENVDDERLWGNQRSTLIEGIDGN